jgi:hypothetical protein
MLEPIEVQQKAVRYGKEHTNVCGDVGMRCDTMFNKDK